MEVERNNAILNKILEKVTNMEGEMSLIRNFIKNLPTKKDIELFNFIDELKENGQLGSEEDLKKIGIKI